MDVRGRGLRLTLLEAVLIGLALATSIAATCIWLSIWLEGPQFAATLRDGSSLRALLPYGIAFGCSGLLGWTLGRLLEVRLGGPGPLFLVPLASLTLVVNGLLTTRSQLETALFTPLGLTAVGALAVLLGAWLWRVARPGRRRSAALTLAVLCWVPGALSAANMLALLRPPEDFATPRGLGLLALTAIAAAFLSAPLVWALREPVGRQRTRRLGVALAFYGLILLLPAYGARAYHGSASGDLTRSTANPPSILLIVVDTLRADAVAGFGGDSELTPNLRELAQDATLFTRAHSAAPWTTPSFGSLLTSTYPSEHQAGRRDPRLGFKYALSPSVTTLAEVLRSNGYWTGAVLTNVYLANRFGLSRGFDDYQDLVSQQWQHPVLVGLARLGLLEIPAYVPADIETRRVLDLVRRGQRSGKPFFALAHYMDPHAHDDPSGPSDGEGAQATQRRYLEQVSYTDRHLGVLVRELQAMGLYDDLLIVFTADHGEELTEDRNQGPYGHGHTLYEELLHVPLMVKRPANEGAGAERTEPVSSIDVAPTILKLVGIHPPDGFEGRPLIGLGPNDPEVPRILFSEAMLWGPEQKAAILGDQKVVIEIAPGRPIVARAYDLAVDPGESAPLSPDSPRFERLLAAVSRFGKARPAPPDTKPVAFDVLAVQRLKALGYVE